MQAASVFVWQTHASAKALAYVYEIDALCVIISGTIPDVRKGIDAVGRRARAHELLLLHWDKVEAVAAALARTLTDAEIDATVKNP